MNTPNEYDDVREMIENETSGENVNDDTLTIDQEAPEKLNYPFLSLSKVDAELLENCYADLTDKQHQLRMELEVVEAQKAIVWDELATRPDFAYYG